MATKKQQRRREKERRHEYEEVWVDADGNEIDYEPADSDKSSYTKSTPKGKSQPAKGRASRSLRTSRRSPGSNCTSTPGSAPTISAPAVNWARPSTTTNHAPSSTWWSPYTWPGPSLIRIARAWSSVASTIGMVLATSTL